MPCPAVVLRGLAAALVIASCAGTSSAPAPAVAELSMLDEIPADHERLGLVVAANSDRFGDEVPMPGIVFAFGVYGGMCPSGGMCATTWALLDTGEVLGGSDDGSATSVTAPQPVIDHFVGVLGADVYDPAGTPDTLCQADMDASSMFIVRNARGVVEVFDECDRPFDEGSSLVRFARSWAAGLRTAGA